MVQEILMFIEVVVEVGQLQQDLLQHHLKVEMEEQVQQHIFQDHL